ncbi:hypothetical protein CK203_048704 [Vitis vinifera]|uniref:Uncharacterized protein n=1 Tax=Vitis vinifera TaxID=29760 RepID=A0A438GWJ5_VITVI|nr:hypothetical protein CK203_048704 [Vitis vinifera]
MSLHKDFEPIRGQLLNRSPAPSLDTAVNELVREEARLATLQAQNKLNILAITPSTPLIEQPQQLGDFSGSSNRRKQTNRSSATIASVLATPLRLVTVVTNLLLLLLILHLLRQRFPRPSLLDLLSTSLPLNYRRS